MVGFKQELIDCNLTLVSTDTIDRTVHLQIRFANSLQKQQSFKNRVKKRI